MKKYQGFSLVELMVVMGLGLILLTGIVEIFNRHQKSFGMIHGLNELQENGRVSASLIAESLRMADHWAGVPRDSVEFGSTTLASSTGGCDEAWVFKSDEAVRGYEGASSINNVTAFPTACIDQGDYVEQSDLLMLRYADGRSLSGDSDIVHSRNSKQHFVRVTAGIDAYVFNGANSQLALSKIPSLGSTYNMAYRAELYFLRPCSNKVNRRCRYGLPTLVRLALSGNRFTQQALVEGVEQLQFSYGIDANEDKEVDRYQTASAVTDWESVISVRLSLLVRNLERDIELDESGKEYLMDGDMENQGSGYVVRLADKQFRRKLYQREIFIRNRGRS